MMVLNMKNFNHLSTKQSGQIAVVVILFAAALVVIGLSLAARTTKEVSLGTQTKESSVVLSAAETGAEKAISQMLAAAESGGSLPQTTVTGTQSIQTDDGVTVNVNYEVVPQNFISMKVPAGDSVMVDLYDPTTSDYYSGEITFKWAKEPSCDDRASLILITYYKESGVVKSRYQAVKPAGTGCNDRGDRFIASSELTGDSDGYHQEYKLDVTGLDSGTDSGDLFVVVRPVYKDTDLMVNGNPSLPIQQYVVTSRGTNADSQAGETRAIRVDYTLPLPPGLTDYALYSGNNLVK